MRDLVFASQAIQAIPFLDVLKFKAAAVIDNVQMELFVTTAYAH